ncbi:MAG: DNA-binding protein [Lachnospiraceae bacterium]|nr:DNA-binding protein [Lachnospiraceae bacterium]
MDTNISSEKGLEERIELSLLYDFYGALLKENQKRMFEENILEDYNFSEIAEEEGISRQGVHDSIKRAARQLHAYEKKLGFVARYKKQREQIMELQALLKTLPLPGDTEALLSIQHILEALMDEI